MWSQESQNILFPLVAVVTEFDLAAVFILIKDRKGYKTVEATMVREKAGNPALIQDFG